MDSYHSPTTKLIYRAVQVVWYFLGLLEALLVLRFILKLLAANPAASFTGFIYSITQPLVAPFLSVFSVTVIEGNMFEWTTLLAMLAYWFLAWAVVELFFMTKTVSTPEAAEKLNKKEQ